MRQAIENANIFAGSNRVDFDTTGTFATAQTITLTSGQLRIIDDVTISGTGSEQLTVSGNNASRVLNISGTGTDARIDGLTIANGNAGTGDGGGILVNQNSNLVLTNSTVEGNRGNLGGGIDNLGTTTVINSTLSNNQGDAGGGILNSGTATLINTTLSGNQARVFGGGGIGNLGIATLINNTITNNTVVANFNSTFGGGIENFFEGKLSVKNTIIAGNTNSNNQEADISSDSDIVGNANNLIGSTSGASGTIGTGSDITFAEAGITNINQVFDPILQNNGGSTATYALVPTSPAINAGNNANLLTDTVDLDGDGNINESIPFDQRGIGFNRIKFATVDIGAYESDTVSGSGGHKQFIVPGGEGSHSIVDFGGVNRGSNPSPATVAEVDTIKFQGTGLTARNLLLTQSGKNLEFTFEGVADSDTKVTLQNFALENLDNLSTIGNLLFNGQTSISDSFDVINADSAQTSIFQRNKVTFLNELSNNIKGLDNSNDVINGQGGNDIIDGRGGDDLLRGGVGNDTLSGGAGNDILVGGAGNDILTGGTSSDQFIYQADSDSSTSGDTITDFNSSQDKLVLTDLFRQLSYSDNNPIADGYLKFVSSGANTQVEIDADGLTSTQGFNLLVTLNNVSASSLVLGSNVLV
ncbi:calcium-binding protein [Nostoc sp. LPT]|uniref:calcium-binding protein n=1 Tax=Nostoc sp. LPT TaxID=2815387 RepID=UPI0025FF8BB3|nr:calcium-binding protein [Nostoc sp. LPT]